MFRFFARNPSEPSCASSCAKSFAWEGNSLNLFVFSEGELGAFPLVFACKCTSMPQALGGFESLTSHEDPSPPRLGFSLCFRLKLMFKFVDGLRTIEFGNQGESRSALLEFIFNGNKRATAGLLSDYEEEGEPVEHVGEVLVVLGNEFEEVGRIRITKVEVTTFIEVPDEFALAEAEGDLNAADFRASHSEFWTKSGVTVTDDTKVVLLYFELL